MLESLQKIEFEIILIFAGICGVIYMSKQPVSKPLWSVTFKGYALAITVILFGIILILNKLKVW